MTTSTLAIGQVIAARYELSRALGSGGVTSAWLARDRETGADVVLKFLDAAELAQGRPFDDVAHPALLAPVARVTDDSGRVAEVHPYLAGGELGRLRGRGWPLLVRRLLPVVDALSALHAAGWVHGDLKSANVLLDGDGLARLADFGCARRVGEPHAAEGSPYSVSPERLDGAPAAPADDIYASGVLLYELVSGHPPFYPELTPQKVREVAPPPLSGRPEPPAELRELVAKCLAKSPASRPASMAEVREALERCLELDAVTSAAPAATFTPRPPVEPGAIRAQWRRTESDAPSAAQWRREGFRRGLLVGGGLLLAAAFGFTFFVLPDLVASRTPAPAAVAPAEVASPAQEPPVPAPDLAKLAELKREADQRREPLPPRLAALEKRDVATWGKTEFDAARADLVAGDAAMEAREYERALAAFAALARRLDTLEKRVPEVTAARLAEARAAFDAGRSAQARQGYESVLRVDAQNAVAKRGLERSRVLDEVLRETAAGAQAEQAGDAAAAMARYRRALELDAEATVARAGLTRLQSQASGEAYSTALAQAQAALARRDFAGAQAGFERAGRLRPGASEVAEGLAQVRRLRETQSLAATLAEAAAAEREERWAVALRLHREALALEPTVKAAQEGVERTEPRAMLDAELQSYLDAPRKLYSSAGRDVVRHLLERASRVDDAGPRLQSQRSRLQTLLVQAETPIRVALASDNATDVQIYRIGRLGAFEHKDLELMPGRYTVVGTRAGFRDVRKELDLLPGTQAPTLVVRCEERI